MIVNGLITECNNYYLEREDTMMNYCELSTEAMLWLHEHDYEYKSYEVKKELVIIANELYPKTIQREKLEKKAADMLTLSMEYNGVSEQDIISQAKALTDKELKNFLDL